MKERLQHFIIYANKIVGSDQNISELINSREIDLLIAERIVIDELTDEETEEIFRFTECADVIKVTFLFSILLNTVRSEYCFQRHVDYTYAHRNRFSVNTQYFLYAQLTDMASRDRYILPNCLHTWIHELSQWYTDYFKNELAGIDYENRTKGLVLVITSQFLGERHSPTKLTMDVCRGILLSGRNVLLINLADALSLMGRIPYLYKEANYVSEYLEQEDISYKEVKIPFAQCERGMPNAGMIQDLIYELREMKPEVIVSIGEDIFSNLIDDMIPVCSVPLQAKLSHNFTKYLVCYNELTIEEREWMAKYGYTDENIIHMTLPFQVLYSDGIAREEIGIPEKTFCIVIVGNRLESELTDEFLEMLDGLLAQTGAVLLTIGELDCKTKFFGYPYLLEKGIHLEYTDKLLAVCRTTDLYVNPPRFGGGTSAIYALTAGKPVVTLDYGDVYKNCGEEFAVSSITEMDSRIKQYINDSVYYAEMSEKALKKAKAYEDVEQNMADILSALERRERGSAVCS